MATEGTGESDDDLQAVVGRLAAQLKTDGGHLAYGEARPVLVGRDPTPLELRPAPVALRGSPRHRVRRG